MLCTGPSLPTSVNVTTINVTTLLVEWSSLQHGQCTDVKITFTGIDGGVHRDITVPCDASTAVLTGLKSNLQYTVVFTTQVHKRNMTAVGDPYELTAWTCRC